MGGWLQCRDAVPIFHPFGLESFVCQRVVLLNRLNPVHRTSIHSRFPSSPAEEGHSWVWRLLERVPTGQGTMSTILAMLDTELRAGGATTAVMVLVAAGVPLWSEVFGTPEARAENTVTLTESNVEIKTATLTISGHTGDWWYLREYPFPQPACASAGSSSTVNLTGLKANTRYLWHAYSDSGCSVANRLTSSVTQFTTKPPVEPSAPTGLTAETGNTSVTLSWTPGDDGGAAITKWQYRQKAGEGAYGQWQDICSDCPSQTSHTISSLTNGTAYTFQVRAVNKVGNGTAASTTVTPLAALTVSGITTTGAKLTISDYTGNWYYKYITPRGGNCSSLVSGTSANLTGLQAGTDYAFRAYSDASCGSMLSTPTGFTTLPPAPAAPTLSVALGRILVRWVPGFVRGATKGAYLPKYPNSKALKTLHHYSLTGLRWDCP